MVDQPTSVERRETARERLAEGGALPPVEALKLVRSIAAQVARLHESGQIHRAITLDNIRRVGGQWKLAEPSADPISLGGPFPKTAVRPPELNVEAPIELPATTESARAELRKANVPIEPERIDAYQLGVVLCELVTGRDLESYLRSPAVKGKVPIELCTLIDRALGFDATLRIGTMAELLNSIEPLIATPTPDSTASPKCISPSASPQSDTSPSALAPASHDDTSAAPGHSGSGRNSEALAPQRLGPYEIIERIGQGGMGDVYKAYDTSLDRIVAIKLLPPELARSDDFTRRFKAEAAAAARLTHPNIVQIHAIGEEAGQHFFVMQYVEGESLAQLLRDRGKLPVDETLAIVEQALSGLAAAHKRGLIHRDIKPGNILLDREHNRALLADFGLVKSLSGAASGTATGVIMGTVDYISPEQGRGGDVDQRSDLYSVGVMLFHMLSGRLPFEATSPTAMIFQHVYEPPPDLSTVAPDVPTYLAKSVARLLAKNPDDRYASADVLLDEWRAWRRGQARAAQSGARTAIVSASEMVELVPPEVDETPPPVTGWWGQLQRRAVGYFQRKAPRLVDRLLNTRQHVDGAIAQYESRCRELGALVTEAEAVILELSVQADEQRRAASQWRSKAESDADASDRQAALVEQEQCERTAADLERQIAEQQSALDEIRVRLAKASATLQQLRSQRDLLNARLQAAQAAIRLEAGEAARPATWRYAIAAGLVGMAVIVGAVVIYAIMNRPERVAERFTDDGGAQPNAGGNGSSVIPDTPKDKGAGSDTTPNPPTTDGGTTDPSPPFDTDNNSPIADEGEFHRGVELRDVLVGQTTGVACAPTKRDGFEHRFRFAVGSDQGDVYLCSVDGQSPASSSVLKLPAHSQRIGHIAYVPDGTRLVTAGDDLTIKVWDLATWQTVSTLEGHTEPVTCTAFSPDRTQMLSGSPDGTVRQWEISSGREIHTFEMPFDRQNVKCIAWAPDGETFLAGTGAYGAPSFAMWNIAERREQLVPEEIESPVENVAYVGGLHQAVLFIHGNRVEVYNLNDGQLISEIGGGPLRSALWAAFSIDGLRALTVDDTGMLFGYSIHRGEGGDLATGSVRGHPDARDWFAMSLDGSKAVSVGRNGQVSAYGLGDPWPRHMQQHKRFDVPLRSVRYAPDDLHAVVAGDTKVGYFGLLGAEGDTTVAEGGAFAAAASSPDGQKVVYAAAQRDTNQIALSAIEATGTTLEFAAHDGRISEVAFTPDGALVLSSGVDGKVIAWDAQSGAQSFEIDVGSPVNDFAVGPNNRLLTGDEEGRLRLWDYSTQQPILEFESGHTLPVKSVAMCRDGSRAVSGGVDRKIFVWDVASGKRIAELQGHDRGVNAVALSRYGEYVLSGSDDGTVRYWDVEKQSELRMLMGHDGPVLGVDISPFDKYGISVGTDGVARVWRLEFLGG